MKNWLTVSLLLLLWLYSHFSLADPLKEEVTIGDDQWVEVPLDFTFPFYGNSYVTSFMFSNGVIGFMNPNQIPGSGLVYDGLCCNSFDFTASNNNYGNYGGVRFDYVIMPWHTDLIDIGTGKFYIQGDDTFQSYFWENISEYYDNTDLNTFDTTIYPTGNIRFGYQAVDIQSHSVTVAIVGDLSAGEYTQWFYNNPSADGGVYWTSGDPLPVEIEAGQSICEVDATASYVCTYYAIGYAEAIYDQNCAADTLYDSGCPGWAAAYLSQQCGINTLYDAACPGYASAYYNQQCGISALYDTGCNGYETAYIDNQCTLDPLYSPSCPGYSAAVAEEEAEEDSSQNEEYEDAWEEYTTYEPETSFENTFEPETFDSSNFSIDTDTYDGGFEPPPEEYSVTFEEVFAELEIEMMEDFGIELESESETEEVLTEETLEEPEIEEPEMEPEVEPEPEGVLDESSNEEEEEEEEQETESEEEEILEDDQDEQQDETEDKSEERKELEDSKEEKEVMVAETKVKEPTAEQKKKAKQKKMREIITTKLNNLAKEMGEAASLEAQKEVQSYILALLNFNLEFNSYNSSLTDGLFYIDRNIYENKKVPENQRGLRNGLANEILHNKLVDIQYRKDYGRSRIQGN